MVKAKTCKPQTLLNTLSRLKKENFVFISMAANPQNDGEVKLTYLLALNENLIKLSCTTQTRAINSIYSLFPGADFSERQISSLFSLKFTGNPHLNLNSFFTEAQS